MTDGFDTATARIASINCTSCGSPLPALAGHRAKSLVCNYCGAVMDRHDDYKLLAQYRDMQRPEGPFTIGMSGALFDVEHTIVGIVGIHAVIEGYTYSWTNYQLYSPTHGYSWMTWSDGHLTHSRKTRDMPESSGHFAYKAPLAAAGRMFKMYEEYQARVTYLEGELTWVPELNEMTQVIEAIDPPYGYAVALGGTETEFEFSTYLDRAETLAAFGVDDEFRRSSTVHAIQPFIPGPLHVAVAKAGKIFAPIAAVIGLVIMTIGGGEKVAETTIQDPFAGGSVVFPLENTNRLVEVAITANVYNSWSWYDMELTNEDTDETIAEFDGGVEYYAGRDSDGAWTEGSQHAVFRFKPPAPGSYRLEITAGDPQSARVPLKVEVKRNVMIPRYLFGVAAIALVLWISLWWRRARFEAKRWGEDEDDDDD